MNKIITQFKSFVTVLAVVAVISIISANSANAGFLDFAKDSLAYGVSYITPENTKNEVSVKPEPEVKKVKAVRTYEVSVSAYNSHENQTDDSPCITANNFNVCNHGIEDTVAANFLPFNTKVKISGFGDRVFYVRDRMNRRYKDGNMDIWMKDYDKAVDFGRRNLEVTVVE